MQGINAKYHTVHTKEYNSCMHWCTPNQSLLHVLVHITILVGKHDKEDYSQNTLLKTANQ